MKRELRKKIKKSAFAMMLIFSFSGTVYGKDWVLKNGYVTVNTDTKELYGVVETDIDYAAELADAPVYYHDSISLNLTVGPEALPANKPLKERKTGYLRFAYPLRERYDVSDDPNVETPAKLMGTMKGVQNASVFSSFASGLNYYKARSFRNTMRLSGLTDSTVIYDCYFAAYIAPGTGDLPLVRTLLRARYNHAYQVRYAWNYPYLTQAQNQAYSGSFPEQYTYLALPGVESANSRYRCVGWLVQDDGSWTEANGINFDGEGDEAECSNELREQILPSEDEKWENKIATANTVQTE